MGYGVGEGKNLCDLSQAYFNKQNIGVDIFNTSVAGYCGINQLMVLKKWIGDYKPNLVILLFHWNDIDEKKSLTVQNGYLVASREKKIVHSIKEWLNNHSHLYCLIKRFYYAYIKTGDILHKKTWYFQPRESDIEYALDYVVRMKQVSDLNNLEFLVVITPLIPIDRVAEFQPNRSNLIDGLRKNYIAFKDWALLLPEDNGKSLIYPADHHFTEEGYLYFSKYLVEAIKEIIDKGRQ
jgi:hypothetical protein